MGTKRSTVDILRTREHVGEAMSFAENAAAASGLGKEEALSLTLATEEIFLYLCHGVDPGQTVEILSSGSAYRLQIDFGFSETSVNFRAFNLTHKPSHESEEDMTEIGLLLASRQVDEFRLMREPNNLLRLTLIKEKRYPSLDKTPGVLPAADGGCAVQTADPVAAAQFARMALQSFDSGQLPPFFQYPDKLGDMVASGDYACAVAADERGYLSGGIFWRSAGTKTMECFGPYIFVESGAQDLSSGLLDACLNDLAKTSAVGLINRYSGGRLPGGYFDELGSYSVYDNENSASAQIVLFRQLREDPGAKVWADPCLDDFLVQEYRRLVLPREVEFVSGEDNRFSSGHSVLTAEFRREQNTVTLHLLWPGEDMEENVSRHIQLFEDEGWRNVSAEIDLGLPWQAGFAPALLKNGFVPRLVLPHAGQGDIALFRRTAALDSLVPAFVKSFEPYIPSRPGDVLKKQYHYETLYRLNNNENALGPPPAARKVLEDFPSFEAAFYPSGDCYHMRLRLADFYGLHPDQFIVGNGANEAITLLVKSFCEIGDNIVTADKTYGGYEWVARFSGIGALLTGLKDSAFDAEAILKTIDGRSKIVFLCNPNNPTGTYWDYRQLTDFLDRIHGRCVVVLDEAYCEFVDKADYPDGMSLLGRYPNLVVFRTFSKMYGLAGLRIGYLAGDIDVVNMIRRTAIVYSVNALAQAAAYAALGDMEHILRTREMVAAGKDLLHRELALLGLESTSGEGNFLSVKLSFSDSLAYRMMMQRGVMVRMMTAFRFPNSIRITVGQGEAMEACVEALAYTIKNTGGSHDGS